MMKKNWMEVYHQFGFVIFKNIISEEQCSKSVLAMQNDINENPKKKSSS